MNDPRTLLVDRRLVTRQDGTSETYLFHRWADVRGLGTVAIVETKNGDIIYLEPHLVKYVNPFFTVHS
jgi:hypothetical protein